MRARRVVRRLHDQLDRRQLAGSLQVPGLPRRQPRRAHGATSTPRSCGSRSGSTAARRGSNPEGYAKHNPIDLVKNWKTPTLVIHGGHDYRVVETQGMATFTALQRKGIPSRVPLLPRREPLGAQAAEPHAVARRGARLAGPAGRSHADPNGPFFRWPKPSASATCSRFCGARATRAASIQSDHGH